MEYRVTYVNLTGPVHQYMAADSIPMVHAIVSSVGHRNVINICEVIGGLPDPNTSFPLTGPPHFFENDVPLIPILEAIRRNVDYRMGYTQRYEHGQFHPVPPVPIPDGAFEQTPTFGDPLPGGTFTVQPAVQPPENAGTIGLETIRRMYDQMVGGPAPMPRVRPGTIEVIRDPNMPAGHVDLINTQYYEPVQRHPTAHVEHTFMDAVPDMETIRNVFELDRTRLEGPIEGRRTEMAMPPVARTREQEDRLAILNRESSERPFSTAEGSEWFGLRDMSPYVPDPNDPPLPRRDRVSVRVVRVSAEGGDRSSWTIEVRINGNQVDFPKSQVIRGLLSDEDKRFLPARGKRYENTLRVLQQALREGLQPQSLHDSLKAWAISTLQQGTEATSDTNLDEVTAHLLRVQPATLEVGGRVYKLIPAGSVDTRPLIARVRKKALAGVSMEATSIREGATRDARIVVNEATDRADNIREQIEAERRRASITVPAWVVRSGRPSYWDGSYWNVEMRLKCEVKEIRFLIQRWEAILFWNPLIPLEVGRLGPERFFNQEGNKLSVWLRLSPGALHLDNVRVKSGHPTVTHISTSKACMALQGLPRVVDSIEGLMSLEASLSRGMRVVNLNSPLDTTIHNYLPAFRDQLPEVVTKLLRHAIEIDSYTRIDRYLELYPDVTWDRTESVIDEARGVFNVETPAPVIEPALAAATRLEANLTTLQGMVAALPGVAGLRRNND